MKKITGLTFLMIACISVYAQQYEVPKNVVLERAGDFPKYEKAVIEGVNWILETPINEQEPKRKRINAFLIKWISGSPDVHLGINANIVTFMNTSPELLVVFMGGWVRQSLVSRDFNNQTAGSKAGIESVIDFYTKNRSHLKKDKNVEKFIKMKSKGNLQSYIEENS